MTDATPVPEESINAEKAVPAVALHAAADRVTAEVTDLLEDAYDGTWTPRDRDIAHVARIATLTAAAPVIREAERQTLLSAARDAIGRIDDVTQANDNERITELRQILAQAESALTGMWKAALTVKTSLNEPYPDQPYPGEVLLSPWTRWVERPAREAHDVAMKIRKVLRAEPESFGDDHA